MVLLFCKYCLVRLSAPAAKNKYWMGHSTHFFHYSHIAPPHPTFSPFVGWSFAQPINTRQVEPFAKAFNDHQTAFFAAVAFVQQSHWFLFSVASLPKLFLQCCQFAALPGAD
jgi:hypothetical protein